MVRGNVLPHAVKKALYYTLKPSRLIIALIIFLLCVNQRRVLLIFTYLILSQRCRWLFIHRKHGGLLAMVNSNETIQVLLCSLHLSGKHMLFFAAINYFLSITATLGNTVILFALNKESSLHPPSRLLYRCLALTDLLVGIISQPVLAVYFTLLVHSCLWRALHAVL